MTIGETSADSTLRLFFAVLPDPATRDLLAAAAGALTLDPAARLVPSDNFHMTLAFIGAVCVAQLPALLAIGAAQRGSKMSLRFDAYEYWPKPEVVVAAARVIPPALQQLWEQLHRDLRAQQWARDSKRLRPHVTIARKVAQAPVLQAMSPIEWGASDFCLMSSDTRGAQSAYTVVATWPLLYDFEKQ